MNKKMARRQRDIKTKLMAAICMLLVSSIMMVSSTYAWFTLSTAPEVTGIDTAVGANGNLEMALLPASGNADLIETSANDGTLATNLKNLTWGNLVDLSDHTYYGLNKITLYPSRLNVGTDGKLAASMLSTPVYGADGRIRELKANTVTATYTTAFKPNEDKGVRAVGVNSGMTERELDYRNARSAGNSAMGLAAKKATQSLNDNGSALASIAVKKGTGTEKFTYDEVKYLGAILNDLDGDGGILEQIHTAYLQYVLAFAASNLTDDAGTAWSTIKAWVEADNADINTVIDNIEKMTDAPTLPVALTNGIDAYNQTVSDVATARSNYNKVGVAESKTEYTWTEINTVVTALADPTTMKVNNIPAGQVMDRLQELIDAVTGGRGLVVEVPTGSGVYADIADQCGDYKAKVDLKGIEYGTMKLNTTAWMETKTTVTLSYLSVLGTAVEGKAPTANSGETMPLSDMYGFIIDMAFRTNAADSKLRLQADAVDRIYSDQTGTDTMGHGASMTFMATTAEFTDAQVRALMGAIRVVFFNPNTGEIIARAKLDVHEDPDKNNATLGTDGWTAKLYIYEITAGGAEVYEETTYDATADDVTYYVEETVTTYTEQTGLTAEEFATAKTNLYTYDGTTYTAVASDASYVAGTTYYAGNNSKQYVPLTGAPTTGQKVYIKTTTTDREVPVANNEIMSLNQNQATALSVLVYLDGDQVTNADVAANGASSMTGSMNLQFSSSANLVPMEYTDLHQGTVETTAPVTNNP